MGNYLKSIGNYGEEIATKYLISKNHILLDKNYRTSRGEIDIISRIDDMVIFIEVKSRYSNNYGLPKESVTFSKQKTIKRIANYYIYSHRLSNYYVRFDVIEIIFNHYNNMFSINHLIDAFR